MSELSQDQIFSVLQASGLFETLKRGFESFDDLETANQFSKLIEDAEYQFALSERDRNVTEPEEYAPVTTTRLYSLRETAMAEAEKLMEDATNIAFKFSRLIDSLVFEQQPLFPIQELIQD